MLNVETRHAIDPATAKAFDTGTLRRHFHVAGIFRDGEIRLIYTHYDRMIVGGAVPAGASLTLDKVAEAGTESLLDRREMVVVNIGGDGTVSAAGSDHAMVRGDMLYLGMGSGPVTFAGEGRFYILSAPAHSTHPTRLIKIAEAATITLGSAEAAFDEAVKGSIFLLSLVACASMMPVERLPVASWQTALGLGFVSSVFDNIPLTALALKQGGYDWGVLAFAVGYGGSMLWFGSSSGVAVANIFSEAKSAGKWLLHGWHIPVGYLAGFFALLTVLGWNPRGA